MPTKVGVRVQRRSVGLTAQRGMRLCQQKPSECTGKSKERRTHYGDESKVECMEAYG
jgi:hypothetical protein